MTPVATLDAAMLIAETAEMPLHNLGVLRFEPSETGRLTRVVTAIDGESFAELWLETLERAAAALG